MVTHAKAVDPRVRRTRQLLQQAYLKLMQEKSFSSISIQDIAERATVNRATFYAHFADKNALLDSIMREQFQQVLASKLPPESKWEKNTLRILIQAALEYFKGVRNHCQPVETIDPLIERATQEELYKCLLAWLKQAPAAGAGRRVPLESLALVISWAIFGAAIEWSREPKAISAEQMTNHVLTVIAEGAAHVTPGLLPE